MEMHTTVNSVSTIRGSKMHTTNVPGIDRGQQQQQVRVVPNLCNSNLNAIIAQLQLDFSNYKYTVYRCASKFVALQQIFHTNKIPYKLVLAILERHGMTGTNASLNLMVPPFQLTSLLHDIYFASEKLGHFSKANSYQLETASTLLANFFWNVYDAQRRHSISLLEIKMTFLLLCKLYSSEHMVNDFYTLLVDSKTQSVTRYAFEQMLQTLSKLFSYLGESKAYGAVRAVQPMVSQCFARCQHSAGLSEQQFHNLWTQTQTRFLIYANLLALIKRIEETQHLIHSNSCGSCRMERIIGIRFKCQVCRDVSLCLPCFAQGQAAGKHEATHRMCEMFVEDLPPPRRWTQYLARLCGWFALTHKTQHTETDQEERRGFCNTNANGTGTELAGIAAETRSLHSNGTLPLGLKTELAMQRPSVPKQPEATQPEICALTGLATTASNASERLQSIIDRLLQQNTKLEEQLQHLASTSTAQISEFLSAHQAFLLQIIADMRQLSCVSNAIVPPVINSTFLTASTPHRPPITTTTKHIYDAYASMGANLTHSINGADINRSYLEANKDYSLTDLSMWFDQRHSVRGPASLPLAMVEQHQSLDSRDTEMVNFKLLLYKVKEIVEDSYSDNAELSAATQNLENVLDSIINSEEHHRRCST